LIAVALCACGGCDRVESFRPPVLAPSTTPASAHKPPPVPGIGEDSAATDELLTKPVARDRAKDGYQWDERAAQGTLRVICQFPFKKVELPAPKHVDFSGPYAIKNPKTVEPYKVVYASYTQDGYEIANEVDYYKKWNPPVVESPLHWIRYRGGNPSMWGVNGAAIIVQGIKSGAREGLIRGAASTAHIRRGAMLCGRIAGNIAFLPQNEKVMLSSHDHFPCEVVFTSLKTGKQIGDVTKMPAYTFPPESRAPTECGDRSAVGGCPASTGPGTSPRRRFARSGSTGCAASATPGRSDMRWWSTTRTSRCPARRRATPGPTRTGRSASPSFRRASGRCTSGTRCSSR